MQDFNKEQVLSSRIYDCLTETWLCLSDAQIYDADLNAIFAKIDALNHLTKIELDNNPLSDTGITQLKQFCAKHPHIRSLTLDNLAITDKAASSLLEISTICELSLLNCSQIKNPFAEAVLKQQHLTKLDLRKTGITSKLILQAHEHVRNNMISQEEDTECTATDNFGI